MCRITTVLLYATLAINNSYAGSRTVEFLSFWVSPGERNALKVISDEFERRGGKWINVTSNDYQTMKREFTSRIAAGFPPGVALWLSGEDVDHLHRMDVTRKNSDLYNKYRSPLHEYDFMRNYTFADDQEIVVPITIHNENWMWFNKEVYHQLGLQLPTTWDSFFRSAPILQENGIMPLAISDQGWNARILFTALLAGVGGTDTYRKFYEQLDASVIASDKFRESLTVLEKLRKLRPARGRLPIWDIATNAVVEGEAAMQVMGDWAKGEFKLADKDFEVNYACRPVFGAENYFIAAIDLFVFPENQFQEDSDGQELLYEIMFDPDIQIDFANSKGSVPAIKLDDYGILNNCAKKSLPALAVDSNRLYSPRLTMPEALRTDIQRQVELFWFDDSISTSEFADNLRNAFALQWEQELANTDE